MILHQSEQNFDNLFEKEKINNSNVQSLVKEKNKLSSKIENIDFKLLSFYHLLLWVSIFSLNFTFGDASDSTEFIVTKSLFTAMIGSVSMLFIHPLFTMITHKLFIPDLVRKENELSNTIDKKEIKKIALVYAIDVHNKANNILEKHGQQLYFPNLTNNTKTLKEDIEAFKNGKLSYGIQRLLRITELVEQSIDMFETHSNDYLIDVTLNTRIENEEPTLNKQELIKIL